MVTSPDTGNEVDG